jgi:hypothetical protein
MEIITTCDHVITFYVKDRKMTLPEIPPAWIPSSRPMSVPGIKYQSFFEHSGWIFTGSLFDRVNFTTVDRYDLRDTPITYKSPQETFSLTSLHEQVFVRRGMSCRRYIAFYSYQWDRNRNLVPKNRFHFRPRTKIPGSVIWFVASFH